MYTDNRVCERCKANGLLCDGENFCKCCEKYLCLRCALQHGELCKKLVEPVPYDELKRSYTEITASFQTGTNGRNGWLKQIKIYKPQHRHEDSIEQIQSQTESNDTKQSSTDDIYSDNILHRQSGELRNEEQTGENAMLDRNTPTNHQMSLSSERSQEERPHYSATGGILRLGLSPGPTSATVLQRCGTHPENNIENYCSEHEALCCEECLIKVHNCCTVQPIDEVAHGVRESRQFVKAIEEATALQETYTEVISKYENYLRVVPSHERVGDSIKERIVTLADNKSATDQHSTREEIERRLSKCRDVNERVGVWLSSIRRAEDSGSEMLTFISYHRNKQVILTAKEKLYEFIPVIDMTLPNRTILPARDLKETPADTDRKGAIKSENRDISQSVEKPTLIADVVLQLRDDSTKEFGVPLNKPENLDASDDYSEEQDEVASVNHTPSNPPDAAPETPTESNQANSARQGSKKKNVIFSGRRYPGLRRRSQDKISTNGLVTEYYMNDDLNDDLRVLRLQSAPVERATEHNDEEKIRPKSMYNSERKKMIQWQNRKMLESVETRSEIIKESRRGLDDKSGNTVSKLNSIDKESNMKDKMMEKKQKRTDKIKQLRKSRKDNAMNPRNKNVSSKKKAVKTSLINEMEGFSKLTDTQRLNKWIKQTEEMNKKLVSETEPAYALGNPFVTDGIDEVYAANIDNFEIYSHSGVTDTPLMPLMVKEATIIKTANRDERTWSAKSRASDSEEFRYNSELYAMRPRTELLLTDEQIVRLPEDRYTCDINSITCMPDGRVIVSDFNNKSIKMFRVGWGKASMLPLEEPPHGVSVVLNATVAVIAGLANDKLLLVNVGHNLTVKRRFKTGCMCKDVASRDSHIYLLCMYRYKTEIRMMTTDGVVSIRMDLGHNIPCPKRIALRPTDGLIYITDEHYGIYTVCMGRITSKSFDKNIERYEDVVIDLNNTVYVCTSNPYGIYELSFDSKHLMPIMLGYGMENVKALAFNASNNSLVVGCSNTETIQIYKICDTLALKSK